jgi:hypothetical protein
VWCLQTFPASGRDAEGDDKVDIGPMGGWHGAGPVDNLDDHGEPQKADRRWEKGPSTWRCYY